MNQDFQHDDVLIEVLDGTQGGLGVITLNRPKIHNALSLDMVRMIASALHRWQSDDAVSAVLFKGAGGKAFCAGGDIKSFYSAGMEAKRGLASPRVPIVFFGEEYSLNKQIYNYPKPTVALMNGITMGGGYGIAGHCDVRITKPETILAMPEVQIGFFPDVGSLYHLNRCPHHYGRYLALTGETVSGKEAVDIGLADVFVQKHEDTEIVTAVRKMLGESDLQARLVEDLVALHGDCRLIPYAGEVEKAFDGFDIEKIMGKLEGQDSGFAVRTLDILSQRSPTSLKVTAAYLERSQGLSFDEIIAMDFVLVQHFIIQHDLYEGIRAQIIDKDKNPKWLPSDLESVYENVVNGYFTLTGYDLQDVQIF